MAEETFKHIVWMVLVMLTFLGVVYVFLVQIGVINDGSSVFDVPGKTKVQEQSGTGNLGSLKYFILIGEFKYDYFIDNKRVSEDEFYLKIGSSNSLNFLTIDEWKQVLSYVQEKNKLKAISIMNSQHPLYSYVDIG